MTKHIVIIGGGASALFLLKAFIDEGNVNDSLDIFEESGNLGMGMPYNPVWANPEHKVNFAFQEFPIPLQEPQQWLMSQSDAFLREHNILREEITQLYIPSRIVTGLYFESQCYALLAYAKQRNLTVNVHTKCIITDIEDLPQNNGVKINVDGKFWSRFDIAIIATGHSWPIVREGRIPGYYDSPFPLSKLNRTFDHPVGLMGSSLSAIDAIRTLARNHGRFRPSQGGNLEYLPNPGADNFRIVMHSRRGLLPSIRFYFEHPRLKKYLYISREEVLDHISSNGGYLSLDYIFEKSYKDVLAKDDPDLYRIIRNMRVEEFVSFYYQQMHDPQPFERFRRQLGVGQQSEINKTPIVWREAIDDMFYTLNFHAKSLSAEDTIRLRNYLMPLAYHDGAFLPFDSCEELLALHDAGKLEHIAVGYNSQIETSNSEPGATFHYNDDNNRHVEAHYDTFIECGGQRQLPFNSFPFKTLVNQQAVMPARIRFLSSETAKRAKDLPAGCSIEEHENTYFLRIPGVAFNDNFQVIGSNGIPNPRIYILANAYIKGMNPDFSGTPFCKDSAKMVFDSIRQIQEQENIFPLSHYAPKNNLRKNHVSEEI